MSRKRGAATAFEVAKSPKSTGRAVRKCRTVKAAKLLLEEDATSEPEDDYDDEIAVAPSHTKKRRSRSLSPKLESAFSEAQDAGASSDDEGVESQEALAGHMTVHLTVNIPLNHQGPITLNLDPKNFARAAAPDKLTQATLARLNARSKSNKNYAGFLDLPAELKNVIYREVFVTEKPLRFGAPGNTFSRTSALLRTCKQVHEEGRSILYSENTFTIERRCQRIGSLWSDDWREMGYLAVRTFMKSIGETNTALIRHISFMLDDAVPCLNPASMTPDDRRFVHDDQLMSVMRHLIEHSQLQTMKLHFNGRRHVKRGDDRFLDYMKRVHADKVEFVTVPPNEVYGRESKQENSIKAAILAACIRKTKKFDR